MQKGMTMISLELFVCLHLVRGAFFDIYLLDRLIVKNSSYIKP